MIRIDDLLHAYRHGFFPMAESREGPVNWCQPYHRAVVPLDTFRTSRSVGRLIRSGRYELRIDTAFEEVIRACSMPRPSEPDTWLSDDIVDAFIELHRLGLAHSVEAWAGEELAGGLYGLSMGGAFFGESMFFRMPGASKVAFSHLVDHLRKRGYLLLDSQIMNPHLEMLGAVEIDHETYMLQLEAALAEKIRFV